MRIKTTTKTEYQQRINVLVEYINNHLGEDIDLNKLAEISGFSRWHFHRIFAEFLGEPVGAGRDGRSAFALYRNTCQGDRL